MTGLEGTLGRAVAYRAAVAVVALMFVAALLILRGVPDRSLQRIREAGA